MPYKAKNKNSFSALGEIVLEAQSLTKSFSLYSHPLDRLKEALLGGEKHTVHTAVKNISFSIRTKEALGIIGRNGAGKSSLLKLITGVLEADSGAIISNGRIAGLLELGVGFDMEATGRENISITAGLLGLSREEISAIIPLVVSFAEIDDFVDMPVRSYSSGMVMRLGFSIAFHSKPKTFVVDEALSVGDFNFQQKCFQKIKEFMHDGGGLLFVSHDLNAVRLLCNRVLVLEQGEVIFDGDPAEAVRKYYELMAGMGSCQSVGVQKKGIGKHPSNTKILKPTLPQSPGYGQQEVRIRSAIWESNSQSSLIHLASGQWAEIIIELESKIPYEGSLGILLRDRLGQDVFGVNTAMRDGQIMLKPGQITRINFRVQVNLSPGLYSVTFAVHTDTTHNDDCQHWWDNALSIEVLGFARYRFSGLCELPCEIKYGLKV